MTAIEIVSLINDGLFLFALIGLTAMVLGFLRLIVLHRRLRPAAMDRETALLVTELPADAELPHVPKTSADPGSPLPRPRIPIGRLPGGG